MTAVFVTLLMPLFQRYYETSSGQTNSSGAIVGCVSSAKASARDGDRLTAIVAVRSAACLRYVAPDERVRIDIIPDC